MKRKYSVIIFQATIKQYRESFFYLLADQLAKADVGLSIVYSKPGLIEEGKKDNIELPPEIGSLVPRLYARNDRILLQFPSLFDIFASDLIIITQATGLLHNYLLLVLSKIGLKKVAFWGHGYNHQAKQNGFSEYLKKSLLKWSSWWFAYTKSTERYLIKNGVNARKITTVYNSMDTCGFRALVESVTADDIVAMRNHLNINKNDYVALFCGSLYSEKKINFLINSALRINKKVPNFRLIVIGAGVDSDYVKNQSLINPCIVYPGPLFGKEKAICFKIAELYLHPGAVGLGILDSFVSGLPFLTTPDALHGPEIDYLVDGFNGLNISGDEEEFARTIIELINNPKKLSALHKGALESSKQYTTENMAKNMCRGILNCLDL